MREATSCQARRPTCLATGSTHRPPRTGRRAREHASSRVIYCTRQCQVHGVAQRARAALPTAFSLGIGFGTSGRRRHQNCLNLVCLVNSRPWDLRPPVHSIPKQALFVAQPRGALSHRAGAPLQRPGAGGRHAPGVAGVKHMQGSLQRAAARDGERPHVLHLMLGQAHA